MTGTFCRKWARDIRVLRYEVEKERTCTSVTEAAEEQGSNLPAHFGKKKAPC